MSRLDRRSFPLILGLLVTASLAPSASAQSQGFNPYGNSGLPDYREFTTPMYGNNPSLPGQARLEGERIGGGSRSNQYDAYSQGGRDLESDGSGISRGSTGPYYRNARSARGSSTLEGQRYEEARKKRDEAYAAVQAEPDLIKRSRLLRQLDQEAMRRPLASAVIRPSATAVPKAKGAKVAPAPPSPADTPRTRGSASAPPPPSGSAPRSNATPSTGRRSDAPSPSPGITRTPGAASAAPPPSPGAAPDPSRIPPPR